MVRAELSYHAHAVVDSAVHVWGDEEAVRCAWGNVLEMTWVQLTELISDLNPTLPEEDPEGLVLNRMRVKGTSHRRCEGE